MNDETMKKNAGGVKNKKGKEDPKFYAENEAECKLVSSRGLMKSMTVRPKHARSDTKYLHTNDYYPLYKGPNSLLEWAENVDSATDLDHQMYIDEIDKTAKENKAELPTVYVVTTAMRRFRNDVLPYVKTPFVLVTGDSDIPPEHVLGEKNITELLENSLVKKWFAQNTDFDHPKMVQMPIGLDYHTLAANVSANMPPGKQEEALLQVREDSDKFKDRNEVIFSDKFRMSHQSRQKIWSKLEKQIDPNVLFIHQNHIERTGMWKEMSKHKFIVSPRGRGPDTHRVWEVLALGSVPLVSNQPHTKLLKDHGLPHIELSDAEWGNLNSEEVKEKMRQVTEQKQDGMPEPLYLEYWVNKIRAEAKESFSLWAY